MAQCEQAVDRVHCLVNNDGGENGMCKEQVWQMVVATVGDGNQIPLEHCILPMARCNDTSK